MSFELILRTIVDECGGGVGAALMESDGIPIEQVLATNCTPGILNEDVSTVGVEFGQILRDVAKASDSLGGGAFEEAILSLSNFVLLFRVVSNEFFLVVVLEPSGNLGKARYLIRKNLLKIRDCL